MKITDVESSILRLPDVRPIGDGVQDVLLIQIHTDEGVTGIGEAHTHPDVIKSIIEAPVSQLAAQGLRELLIGEDPLRVTYLWEKMYRHTSVYGRRGVVMHAISGIDIALWDIVGKVAGQPLYRLFGGTVHEEVDVYASDLAPDKPADAVQKATSLAEQGYMAMKFGWGGLGGNVRDDSRWVHAVRREVGPEVDLMLDMGMPIPLDSAIWLGQALAEDQVAFLEEPLAPDDLDGYAELVRVSPTPIATGEKESTRFGFAALIEQGGLRIIQPDLARVGGFTEARRIAALAETKGVRIVPHCWSTDILVSATLHFITSLTQPTYLEFNVRDQPLRRELITEPITPQGGVVRAPNGPGLGVRLNSDVVARLAR